VCVCGGGGGGGGGGCPPALCKTASTYLFLLCVFAQKGNDVHAVIMGCMLARVIGCMLCSIETNITEISHRNQIDKIADVAVC
jgi:hypothetical protein